MNMPESNHIFTDLGIPYMDTVTGSFAAQTTAKTQLSPDQKRKLRPRPAGAADGNRAAAAASAGAQARDLRAGPREIEPASAQRRLAAWSRYQAAAPAQPSATPRPP